MIPQSAKPIGGDFIAIGKLEYHLLRSLGLDNGHLMVDIGCGHPTRDAFHIPIPEEIVFDHGARMGTLATLGQSVAVLKKT